MAKRLPYKIISAITLSDESIATDARGKPATGIYSNGVLNFDPGHEATKSFIAQKAIRPKKGGAQAVAALVKAAIEVKIISKKGKNLVFGEHKLGTSQKAATQFLSDNSEVLDEIKEEIE